MFSGVLCYPSDEPEAFTIEVDGGAADDDDEPEEVHNIPTYSTVSVWCMPLQA